MQIYLVGGAVRDQLLGLPVKERDWVVVGATPEQMLAQGFQPVGKDFPVFLHPETHEEYALARTERKISKGYTGFNFYTSPEVSLEEDLKRRDLTINAMAQTPSGELIDPYGGREDLQNKWLRHVSPAFIEDPVRILRVARFAARFADFNVHPETNRLMQTMVENGEVNALVPERVWQEWHKALNEQHPERFFIVLENCKALPILFPEFAEKEINQIALSKVVTKTSESMIRFAVLLHMLTAAQIKDICQRLRIPNEFRDLALITVNFYKTLINLPILASELILELITNTDALRRPQRFDKFLLACECLSQKVDNGSIANLIRDLIKQIKMMDIQAFVAKGLKGEALAGKIKQARILLIENFIRNKLNQDK